jgi:flagellum-specific peptidoglycan hydrolase FlgJ
MKQVLITTVTLFFFFLQIANSSAFAPLAGAEDEEDEIVRRAYIMSYGTLAIEEMKRSNVPASIILAQGILESEWGRASLAKQNKNHFGIKCSTGWRGACAVYSTKENEGEIIASFRQYKVVEESYWDHSEILMNSNRYAKLFDLHSFDYKSWAHGLKNYGYAGDPLYAKKLIKIIEFNQLYELDGHYTKPMPASLSDIIPLLRSTQKGLVFNNAFGEEVQAALTNTKKKKKK